MPRPFVTLASDQGPGVDVTVYRMLGGQATYLGDGRQAATDPILTARLREI